MDFFLLTERFKNTLPASLAGRSLEEEHVCSLCDSCKASELALGPSRVLLLPPWYKLGIGWMKTLFDPLVPQ